MKLVIQRVKKATVSVEDQVVGQIGGGLFVLVGVGKGDTKIKAKSLADKISKLRIMSDEFGKMNLSVKGVDGQILAVSQFTLYADTGAGNRPSFINAEQPEIALGVYNFFVECLRENGIKVETGSFGKHMIIQPILDGPVTILLEA